MGLVDIGTATRHSIRGMTQNSVPATIGYLRIGVGALSWAAPNLTGRLFGLDPAGNLQSPYLLRLFGIRDLALGAGTLTAGDDAQRAWLTAGLACDVSDVAAALAGRRAGYLSTFGTLMLAGAASTGVALGVIAMRNGKSPPV
jgi:hypothetical protein